MNELKHLALVASLREVFSGTDWNIKKECIEAIGPKPVGVYLTELFDNVAGKKDQKWLAVIGQSFSQYHEYSPLTRNMDCSVLDTVKEAIEAEEFNRRKFSRFISCDKDEAKKHDHAYRVTGECVDEYNCFFGYFVGVLFNEKTNKYDKKEMTAEQIEWMEDYAECCYNNGQPCHWQTEDGSEDCECVLGREYGSLVLCPLDVGDR